MMTVNHYFFPTTNIENVKSLLEDAFQIKFIPHDSYHYGDYYLYEKTDGNEETSFMLCQNIMFEGELHYPELEENTVILSAGSTTRGDNLKLTIESLGAKHMQDPDSV